MEIAAISECHSNHRGSLSGALTISAMAQRTSLIRSISTYVTATSATLTGRRALAAWSHWRPRLSPYRDIAALVAECRDGGPLLQDCPYRAYDHVVRTSSP